MASRVASIIPSKYKAGAFELGEEIAGWLAERSVSSAFGHNTLADFAIVIGGDGFAMKQSKELAADNTPLIVVNFGTLGFLAAAEKDNWRDVFAKILDDRYVIEQHGLLSVVHHGSSRVEARFCCCSENRLESVGDVYIRHKARMIVFSVAANNIIHANMRGDAVVVATPLGSTAYNLAAGGPVIEKGAVVTPICVHPIPVRPWVLEDFDEIKITYHGVKGEKDEGCLLFVDGEDYPINPGDEIAITKSSRSASLIIPEGFSFAKARREKLGL